VAGECAAGAPAGCRGRGSPSAPRMALASSRSANGHCRGSGGAAGPAISNAWGRHGPSGPDQDGRASISWLNDCVSATARRSPLLAVRDPFEAPLGLLEVGVDLLSRSARCRRAGRPGLRDGRRSDLREPGRHERSHRSRGCWPGAGLPRPSPRWAPVPSPAMSWKAIVSGTTFGARTVCATASSRGSATGTTATLGSIVDRREWMVGCLRGHAGQGAEQRRRAGARYANDLDLHRRALVTCAGPEACSAVHENVVTARPSGTRHARARVKISALMS
jgi:hypothetical protein